MPASRESRVHPARVHWAREGPPATGARYVLYWIQVNQRARMNDALDFAVEQADALGLPVLAYQGLRPDYPGANDRIHTFILEGAVDLAADLEAKGIRHLFHLERRRAAAAGLLASLARDAALVVTDHFPVFIVPGQTRALARQIERPLAAVEASCIVPPDLFPRAEVGARTLRPKIHRVLHEHLVPREEIAPRRSSLRMEIPFPHPMKGLEAEERCWLDLEAARIPEWVASCDIDHRIAPSPVYRGGSREARARLARFVAERLPRYAETHNDPAREGTSGLSPYLHFGQISAAEVALAALSSSAAGRGDLKRALPKALADRESPVGAFIEQLVVRRELAFNFCERNPRFSSVEGLPGWAQRTLAEHGADPRAALYTREALEWSETEDEVWNAAQTELRLTGVIHNRLRMIWGKRILEWTEDPAEAVAIMLDLHERYALDGRDPNTYASVLWCLGLHDRPFGPARKVIGLVRPMSSEIARKKFNFAAYVARLRGYEK
jgi:deoxyribodipyrimidine photo-lyase